MFRVKDLMNYDCSILIDEFIAVKTITDKGMDGRLIYHSKSAKINERLINQGGSANCEVNKTSPQTLCLIVTANNIEFCPVSNELTKLIHETFDFN